jgi:hypothetical protein
MSNVFAPNHNHNHNHYHNHNHNHNHNLTLNPYPWEFQEMFPQKKEKLQGQTSKQQPTVF